MKVVAVLGSPRVHGNTARLIEKVLEGAASKGAETRLFHLNQMKISDCQSCYACQKTGSCALKDDMAQIFQEIQEADAIVIGSPIYMWQMTGMTKVFMDRLYPFIDISTYTPRLQGRKSMLVFTQGNANETLFKPYMDSTAAALKFLGFPVEETLVVGGVRQSADLDARGDAIQAAYEAGQKLVS